MSSGKVKKIVVTPEEVANSPSRKTTPKPKTQSTTQQTQISEDSAIQVIQVNDLSEVLGQEVSTVDAGKILGQQIAIQITDDVTPNVGETAIMEVAVDGQEEDEDGYVIQSADDYRKNLLENMYEHLAKYAENYADLAIFCADGVVWSNKLLLSAASPYIKDMLLDVPIVDDTCLIIPHMTKRDFLTFQSTIFAKEETHPDDVYSVIRGCEIFAIDTGTNMCTTQDKSELPSVDYAHMLSNPFEKKRIYKSLGYVTSEGNKENEPDVKGAGQVIKVLQDSIKCEDCNRTFFDNAAFENHQKLIHSSYKIDTLVQ